MAGSLWVPCPHQLGLTAFLLRTCLCPGLRLPCPHPSPCPSLALCRWWAPSTPHPACSASGPWSSGPTLPTPQCPPPSGDQPEASMLLGGSGGLPWGLQGSRDKLWECGHSQNEVGGCRSNEESDRTLGPRPPLRSGLVSECLYVHTHARYALAHTHTQLGFV